MSVFFEITQTQKNESNPCQNLGQDLMVNFEAEIFCELARTYEIS